MDRHPVVDGGVPERELAREDANDFSRAVVHEDRAADDRTLAAVASLPKPVADHDDRRARAILVFRKRSAGDRLHAENGKEVRRHTSSEQLFGNAVACHAHRAPARRGHAGEGAVQAHPLGVVARRRRIPAVAGDRIVLPDHDEPIRIAVRQRADEQRIHRGKDRCVGPDAKR